MAPGFPAVAAIFDDLEDDCGTVSLEKVVPNAAWGDTLRTNIRTGATVSISDYSQLFYIRFANPAPVTDVVADFEALAAVRYAEEPVVRVLTGSMPPLGVPDDPEYDNGNQYSLGKVEASRAWDITRGLNPTDPVGVAISDVFWCDLADAELHPDLQANLEIVECFDYNGPPYDPVLQHGYAAAGVVRG